MPAAGRAHRTGAAPKARTKGVQFGTRASGIKGVDETGKCTATPLTLAQDVAQLLFLWVPHMAGTPLPALAASVQEPWPQQLATPPLLSAQLSSGSNRIQTTNNCRRARMDSTIQ